MEQRILGRLGRLNQTGVFLATIALVLVALLLPGPVGGALLLVLAAVLGWLLLRTWPMHRPPIRVARVAILALLVILAVTKLF
jgi:hypothetical protein